MTASENPVAPPPRLIAWEVTRRCLLRCRHCRGASKDQDYADELTPGEARDFRDRLAVWAHPILIFTGGETLLRPDIFDLLAQARNLGFRTALATCGGRKKL